MLLHKIRHTLPEIYYLGMHTTHLRACLHTDYSNLAQKVYKKKTTKMHYHDNIEYRDILTHDNRHQLFLISPIPSFDV